MKKLLAVLFIVFAAGVTVLSAQTAAPTNEVVRTIQDATNIAASVTGTEAVPEAKLPLVWVVVLSLFYVLFPALAITLNRKVKGFDKIDPLILCYAAGILLGNFKILPEGAFKFQDTFASVIIPLALPLIFFSIDIRKWFTHAKKTFLASVLQIVSVVITVFAIFLIFRKPLGSEAWMLSSMYAGVYTGGTINMAAIKTALGIPPNLYVAAQAADVVFSSLFILFSITVAQKLFLKFLPAYKKSAEGEQVEEADFGTYDGIFKKDVLLPLLGAFGLSVLITGIGLGVMMIVPQQFKTVAAILLISTLGVLSSLIPAVRNIKKTFQFGEYLVLIFCVIVGSMANFQELLKTAPMVMVCTVIAIFGSLTINLILAKIFRIDADTMIVVANAGINSPPMVPMIAAGLKNKEVVVSGMIAGILGWILGTYLGIGLSYIFRAMMH